MAVRVGTLVFRFGLLLTGCQKQAEKPLESSAAYVPIFTQNREFTYLVSRFRAGRPFVVDTVLLTSTGKVWAIDSAQTGIFWKNADNRAGTGIIESPDGVWSHPPRFDEYRILELSPFPETKLPFQAGQEWDWELAVGDHYSNTAWAVWKGDIVVRTHYKYVGNQTVDTPLGRLACQRVTAESRSPVGESALQLLFHPRYGFVELDYHNIDGQRLRFQLVSVGIENKFEAGNYFGKQQ